MSTKRASTRAGDTRARACGCSSNSQLRNSSATVASMVAASHGGWSNSTCESSMKQHNCVTSTPLRTVCDSISLSTRNAPSSATDKSRPMFPPVRMASASVTTSVATPVSPNTHLPGNGARRTHNSARQSSRTPNTAHVSSGRARSSGASTTASWAISQPCSRWVSARAEPKAAASVPMVAVVM